MSDIITKILLVILIGACTPFIYLFYFLIIELPKKYGYLRFSLIVVGYISIVGYCTLFLAQGLLGLIAFFLIPNLVTLLGAWCLRVELGAVN